MSLRVSTTGSDVILNDLGIVVTHPTTDRDLSLEFTAVELRDSEDLTNAVQNGDLDVDDGTHFIHQEDYDPDELLIQELGYNRDRLYISHDELHSTGKSPYLVVSGVFPVDLNSTSQATKNVYCPSARFITWQADADDIVEVLGCTASGLYTIDSVTDQQNFILNEAVVDSTGGTINIYHPPASTRIGCDDTNFVLIEGEDLQTVLESIDDKLGEGGFSDELVKVSSNDTTAGYLTEKLITTSGLELVELSDGGDEDLQIALDINGLPEDTNPNVSADYIAVYCTSAGVHRKVMLANLPAPAVGAYGTGIYLCSPFSWSNPVPLGVCTFQTIPGMHDPTNHDTGTALGSQTGTTLQDTSKSWTVNEYATYTVRITGGTGVGQWRTISSNTSNTLTIGTAWDTTPDGTSTYEISRSSRLIVPKDGIYNITAHCSFQVGTGAFGVAILQNSVYRSVTHLHNAVDAELTPGNTRFLNLEEDDYIEMKVWNGDTGTLLMNSGALRLYLEMNRVGG